MGRFLGAVGGCAARGAELPLGGVGATLVPPAVDCPCATLLPPVEGDAPAPELPIADL